MFKSKEEKLVAAFRKKDYVTVEKILDEGVDPNLQSNGDSLLIIAVKHNNRELAQRLIEKGASVNFATPDGETALTTAASYGYLSIASLLLDNKANVNQRLISGETPLLCGVSSAEPQMVELLIAKGADLDCQTYTGATPLMKALMWGYTAIAQQLVEAGADVNIQSKEGKTALHYAGAGMAPLLIEKGADINHADQSGVTPLLRAASEGHGELAQLLVNAGADVNIPNKSGATALMGAIGKKDAALVLSLLEHGATGVDWKDNKGRSLLARAIGDNQTEIARHLAAHGADVNEKDADGNSMLRIATAKKNDDMVKMLIEHGADVRGTLNEGDLLKAAEEGNLALVKECLAAGVPVDAHSGYKSTALHNAAYKAALETVEYLVGQGARLDIVDRNGRTPLAAAKAYNSEMHKKTAAFLEMAENASTAPEWSLIGSSSVAHVECSLPLRRQITEIFNFAGRQHRAVCENLRTGQETSEVTSFDNLGEKAIRQALEEFKKLGGEADEEFVLQRAEIKKSGMKLGA